MLPSRRRSLQTTKTPKPAKNKEASKDSGPEQREDPFDSAPTRFEARDVKKAQDTPQLLELYREKTGGKIVTRFPPEPNGYLYVGHAKAMFIDFGYAVKMGGDCILRFDDTTQSVEKTEYVDAIIEMSKWVGHKAGRISYSSVYFDQLFELALELIRRRKAYACHLKSEEMSLGREEMSDSSHRDRSVEENVRRFHDMRNGKYGEGEATLRMKIDMHQGYLVMHDPVAYRVLHMPHLSTGDKRCVYPLYDYTHCILDSLEWGNTDIVRGVLDVAVLGEVGGW